MSDDSTLTDPTRHANTSLALEAGRVGTWTWDIASGRTVWDANLEQLHGLAPGTFGGTFEDWYESLHPDDRDECVRRVELALAARQPYVLLHRTRWLDGSTHWIECRGTVILDAAGEPTGTTGIAFDVTAHRQHLAAVSEELQSGQRLVDTLQRALLPATLPSVERITVATRYRSARGPGEIGGDWYASVPLDGARLGVAIGDVAGHGLEAVADMAAARFGLRALAASEPAPERVLEQLSRLVRMFEADTMITALYGVLDPLRLSWTYANAGHCSPVVRHFDGQVALLDPPPGPPLGYGTTYATHAVALSPGATIVLYTDGLVERRPEPITVGMARLVDACAEGPAKADDLCDFLLARLVGDRRNEDDIAIAVLTVD